MHIFDASHELSDPPIDSKGPTLIKVQKRSKDIGKIIHVTSGFNRNFTKLRELLNKVVIFSFFCAQKVFS